MSPTILHSRLKDKDIIAKASFGTQFGVSVLVGFFGLFTNGQWIYFIIILMSVGGSSLGYLLWVRGHRTLSTTLSTGGLLAAGISSHVLLQTIGGPTGILLLASVITAGGLGGKKEATITSLIALIWLLMGYFFIPHNVVLVPEIILLTFVGSSIPCWGAYVIAVDISNRNAKLKAEESLSELQQTHHQLKLQQNTLEQTYQQQNKVLELGMLAMSEASASLVLKSCLECIQKDQDASFAAFVSFDSTIKIQRIYPYSEQCFNLELDPNYWPGNKNLQADELDTIDPQILQLTPNASHIQGLCVPIQSSLPESRLVFWKIDSQKLSTSTINFIREIAQLLQIRYMREAAMQERARLAAHIQQEERLESLIRMAGEIAHDFNNTLMIISGTGDLFQHHSEFPQDLQSPLSRMQNAAQISAELTNKLLTFCRGVNSPKVLIDPIKTIHDLMPLLEFKVQNKISININQIKNVGRKIKMGNGQMEQILLNLISNSKEAISDRGTIEIELNYVQNTESWVGCNPEQATHFFCKITDNGSGMSTTALQHAIEPFFSQKPPNKGGGLGLAIVHGIVSQTQGLMNIESKLGEGTSVSIFLPLHDHTVSNANQPHTSSGDSILLVDDEDDVRYAVAMQLDMIGYNVIQAQNISEATILLKEHPPLLLITDIRLHNQSGYDLVAIARNLYPQIPVLYITGFAGHPDEHKSHSDAILVKPFSSLQLKNKIESILHQTPILKQTIASAKETASEKQI